MTYNFLNGKIADSSMILPVMVSQGKGVRTTYFFYGTIKHSQQKFKKGSPHFYIFTLGQHFQA